MEPKKGNNFLAKLWRRAIDPKSYFQYSRNRIFERALSKDMNTPSPLDGKYKPGMIKTSKELAKLELNGFDMSICPFAEFARGIPAGAALFFILMDKELAHLSWVSMNSDACVFDPIFQKLRFPRAGYIGPCFTSPQHRGRGLYPYALIRICQFLKESGRDRAFIATKISNIPSIKGILRAGFTPFVEYSNIRLLSRNLYKVNSIKSDHAGVM